MYFYKFSGKVFSGLFSKKILEHGAKPEIVKRVVYSWLCNERGVEIKVFWV